MSLTATKELIELKEDLKKEAGSESGSESRILDMLKEIEKLCAAITREAFVDSKIGATVKKLADGTHGKDVKEYAAKLMEKWRTSFAKKDTPLARSSSTSSVASVAKPVSTIAEITKSSGPQDPKRQKTCAFLAEAFAEDVTNYQANQISNVCIDIEEAIYQLGQDQYVAKGRTLRLNLPKNHSLRQQVLKGELNATELVSYSSEELLSDHHREALQKGIKNIEEEKRSDWLDANREQILKAAGVNMQDGMFPCRRCGSRKTTYYQKQTRSADEPMTVFVQCIECKHQYRTQ